MATTDWSWSQRYYAPTILLPQPSANTSISPTQQYYPNQHAIQSNIVSSDPQRSIPQTPTTMAPIPEHQPAQPFTFTANAPGPHALHSSNSLRSLRPSMSGRKRSRDDFSDAMSESDYNSTSPFPSVAATPAGEPTLGPGMSLIYPNDTSSSRQGASTAAGIWTEELIEQFRSQSVGDYSNGPKRLSLSDSRKSMRLGPEASTMEDVVAYANIPGAARADEPTVDSATLALGVSWSTLPATPTMSAAARGWARYIEEYYPLQSARVIWHYRAGPAYLVSASTCTARGRPGVAGYYLFDDNLTEGKLVAKSFEKTLDNLRQVPIAFDGLVTMRAGAGTGTGEAAQDEGMDLN